MTNLLEFVDDLGAPCAFNPTSIDAIAQAIPDPSQTRIWMDGICTTVTTPYAEVLALWKAQRD